MERATVLQDKGLRTPCFAHNSICEWKKILTSNMSHNKNSHHTFSEGVQCELGKESYRNCLSFMRSGNSEKCEYEPYSECQGIDLSIKQEKQLNIKSGNKPFKSYKSDAEDRSKIIVEVDPSIFVSDNDVEFCDFVCGDCGLQYPDSTLFEAHCKAHNTMEPFKCVECSLRFQDYCSYDMHRGVHSTKQYNCTDCKKKFSLKWSLMVHSQVHRSRPHRKCEQCGLQFLNEEFFTSHLMSTHNFVENILTKDQTSVNLTEPAIKNIQNYKTNTNLILDCEHCDLKFESKSDLSHHQKMHSDSLLYKCEKCETECTTYSEIRDHVNSTHDNFDVHYCENCGGTGFVSSISDDDQPTTSGITQNIEIPECMGESKCGSVKGKSVSKIRGIVSKKTVRIKKSNVQEKFKRKLRSVNRTTKPIFKKVSFEVTLDQNHSRKFCEFKFAKKRKGKN